MFDHLLESSQWDDSNKWSNVGFGQEMDIIEMKKRTLSVALKHMSKKAVCLYVHCTTNMVFLPEKNYLQIEQTAPLFQLVTGLCAPEGVQHS